jgi:hypothetical protein
LAELPQSILCNPIALADYVKYCCTGKLPANVASALSQAAQDPILRAILCTLEIIGKLEPEAATRPGVCDPAVYFTRQITLPAATLNADGSVTPSEARVISFCAPTNRALVVEESRVSAGNDVAANQPVPMPVYKRVNLATFGEWCLPFEPDSLPGSFVNVEHIIVPSSAGYSVYVQNYNPNSEAVYDYKARFWASC